MPIELIPPFAELRKSAENQSEIVPERFAVQSDLQSGAEYSRGPVDARRHPRYKVEVEIRVYPRNRLVIRGTTLDLSESGISAMLRLEIPLAEVLRLEFTLPHGHVETLAVVRQRNAFRYGFQFVESSGAQDIIGRTCRDLALEQGEREIPPRPLE